MARQMTHTVKQLIEAYKNMNVQTNT